MRQGPLSLAPMYDKGHAAILRHFSRVPPEGIGHATQRSHHDMSYAPNSTAPSHTPPKPPRGAGPPAVPRRHRAQTTHRGALVHARTCCTTFYLSAQQGPRPHPTLPRPVQDAASSKQPQPQGSSTSEGPVAPFNCRYRLVVSPSQDPKSYLIIQLQSSHTTARRRPSSGQGLACKLGCVPYSLRCPAMHQPVPTPACRCCATRQT